MWSFLPNLFVGHVVFEIYKNEFKTERKVIMDVFMYTTCYIRLIRIFQKIWVTSDPIYPIFYFFPGWIELVFKVKYR